jgi:lipid II:glycine glycyltransferase (peptidoglycan interpeptide bridge formation enzyme)
LDEGRSDILLDQFYQLLLLTRRRHRVPPQPFAWFRNLVDCMGDRLTIHVARVGDRPIASILTLRHKQTLVYKYGCSDEHFHNLGAMPRLFWQAIQEAKSQEFREFDLGRSDETNLGLVRFKDHLGATGTSIQYRRFPIKGSSNPGALNAALKSPLFQNVLLSLPDRLFRLAGEILYRHAG